MEEGLPRPMPFEPLVADEDGSPPKRWIDALRPFNFDVGEAPLCVRIWQRGCLYIPAAVFLAWCYGLAYQLYWNPILCIVMCDIHLAWSIIEQGRFLLSGVVAFNKVIEANASCNSLHATGTPNENGSDELRHAVFICAYKENIEVLRQTLLSIATQKGHNNGQSYACSQIGVCLCMEAREGEIAEQMARQLVEEFRDYFEWMDISYHPDKVEGEIQGKCSNLQWAINNADSRLGPDCLVTCGDSDSMFDPHYFSAVAAKYTECGPSGESMIFQPTVMHLLNIFEQNPVVRATSIFTTVVFAGSLEDQVNATLPYSTFTVSSTFMKRFNGWDVDYLNDDWHVGTKAFVAQPLNAQVVHMPFPVVNCAVESETWMGALNARWKQAKRHALGVEELVYLLQMLPVCHQKLSWRDETRGLDIVSMYIRFFRVLGFVVSVHIRFALMIPCGLASTSVVLGVWIQRHLNSNEHFPLYGQTPQDFMWTSPFVWSLILQMILCLVVLGKCFLAVRLVHHLVAVGRVGKGAKLPWWALSQSFQYVHNFVSMGIALPIVALGGSAAEIIALFRVAVWNKDSFEFYVAPKVAGDDQKLLDA